MNKKILSSVLLGTLLMVVLVLPVAASAAAEGGTLTGMAAALQKAITTIGGAIVFIGWVVAGILWLTSAGSPEKIGTAKKALVACVIGTLLVIIAQGTTTIANIIKEAFNIEAPAVPPPAPK